MLQRSGQYLMAGDFFFLHFARFFVLDQEVELHFRSEMKINKDLFCISLAFSYLRDKILKKAQNEVL